MTRIAPSPEHHGEPPNPESDLPPLRRIRERLAYLYGETRADPLLRRITRLLNTHRQLRPARPHARARWDESDLVLISYGDSVQAPGEMPLATLRDFLGRHLRDAFSMVHVLPFFPWSSDDGFSVTDFRAVKQELGGWADIADLASDFDLVVDLVLNHCSRENLWFIDYLMDEAPACHYFIEMDPASNLSMVTRPRSTPLLSGVRTKRGMRHVWTTFSNDQIDLNYANPDVLLEFIDLLLYYIRRGARMIRLDAVAYLWKQPGTRCIHLPQTHQVVKLFRDVLDEVEPSGLIMTETNVPHVENIGYFGDGDEAHLVYQFSLPPLLLHALFSGDGRYLNDWAEQLESQQLPPGCTYLNFTASHDGIGLRPLEGLLPPAELEALLAAMRERGGYISSRANRDGSVSPYELNISYFDAFREPDGSLQRQIRMFLLAQLISLSLKGIPAVYLHSLTATGNDAEGVERTGMTRAINRRKWDRGELEGLIANPDSATGQVFARYRALLALRRAQPAFHPDADQRLLRLDDRLFCCERTAPQGQQRILVLANLAPDPVSLAATALSYDPERLDDLLAIARLETGPTGFLVPGHAIFWWQVAS